MSTPRTPVPVTVTRAADDQLRVVVERSGSDVRLEALNLLEAQRAVVDVLGRQAAARAAWIFPDDGMTMGLTDQSRGQWKITTEHSAFHLDLDSTPRRIVRVPGVHTAPDGTTFTNRHPSDGVVAELFRIDQLRVGASAALYRAYLRGIPEPYLSTWVCGIDRVPFPEPAPINED